MTGRGSSTLPAAPASLPDDDDLLREILLRLPPQPSSLTCSSAVCRCWRRLVTDPKFHRQFCVHHRKPPLLGLFQNSYQGIVFNPMLNPPDRIPPQRFDLGCYSGRKDYGLLDCRREHYVLLDCRREHYVLLDCLLDCRHGLVLVKERVRNELAVCDPITGGQRRVAVPLELWMGFLTGAVLCDHGHVHSGCHLRPFKVVLTSMRAVGKKLIAYVYSSETGIWGNVISTAAPLDLYDVRATLVGNALYWLSQGDGILEFNLDGQSLDVIAGPLTDDVFYRNRQIVRGEGGAVGFAILSCPRFQTWQRNANGHNFATWVPWKTIEMHTILGHPSLIEGQMAGYDEDNGVIFFKVDGSVYTVQLMSTQFRKLYEIRDMMIYHPFTSFFIPVMNIDGSRYIG